MMDNLPGVGGIGAPRPHWVWAFLGCYCPRSAPLASNGVHSRRATSHEGQSALIATIPAALDDESLPIILLFRAISRGFLDSLSV